MKKIFVLLTTILIAQAYCLAQPPAQMNDSVREARMQQMRQLMQERGAELPAQATTPVQGEVPTVMPTNEQRAVQSADNSRVQSVMIMPQESPSETARLALIRRKLDGLEDRDDNFGREVEELSVSGLPLAELLRNIALVYDVNINVRGGENIMVTCNFARVGITDLIYLLCKEYDLDIDVVGNIVSVFPAPSPVPQPKLINVMAGDEEGTISYDLSGDRLADVTRLITSVGRVNFIIPHGLNNRPVSGHGQNMSIDEAVVAITAANDLRARKNNNGIWEIADAAGSGQSSFRSQSAFNDDQLFVDERGRITAQIARGNVQEIITDLCEAQGMNYYFIAPVMHTVPLNVHEVSFETLLGVMFSGTDYSYYREDGIYFFGNFSKETLNSVRVIPMVYRSVAEIDTIIPKDITTGLDVKVFADLNSIIASGNQRQVHRLENFMRSIDRRVPLVTIEVMIVDVTKTALFEAGLGMGIGTAPVRTGGTMSPGVDMTLGSGSVNNIIGRFNGFGSINLGRVTPEFYMTLRFMEENGTIQMLSTPKLATLNGRQATLTSGEISYYKEVSTNFFGMHTPTPSESYVWKEVEAKLEIDITPYVSEDGLITLDITVLQEEFTERVEADGPPGIYKRKFESIIRVQNEDMVLLGGIDRNSRTVAASGLPWIAKVPVIRWFFGKEKRNRIDQTLNVFIKPTVIF
ncbi:MAG: type II secretion system protein GspD [Rikenellaceae bacterium]|nr:type II secretion system protein GspD [Rikenellaceae bacterium]